MSFLHTPGCRITWTRVRQGARENILRVGDSVEFTFGVSIDQLIWFQPGNFRMDFTILDGQNQTLVNQPTWRGWTATDLPAKPATSFWVQQFFWRAGDATGNLQGIFKFSPSIRFLIGAPIPGLGGPFVPDEWAVAEEEHFFNIEP
jgi:hypothetical protein